LAIDKFQANDLSRYVCEISPPSKRGTLASVVQFFITSSICVGYFVCYGSVKIESSWAWRVPFVLMAAVAFLYSIATLLFLPYSPRWLTMVGRKEEAMALWEKLEVPADDREKEEHVNDGMNTAESRISERPVSIKEKGAELLAVFKKKVRKRTALGVFLMGMQQLGGIDGVLYVLNSL
jgi:MFS family permease